jgi:DNA-binding transcriptional MerR regulator
MGLLKNYCRKNGSAGSWLSKINLLLLLHFAEFQISFPLRLVKTGLVWQITGMSFVEIKEALATLSPQQRAELEEQLHALDEGVTVEQLREINAMLDEELNDPSASFTLEQARERIRRLNLGDAARS